MQDQIAMTFGEHLLKTNYNNIPGSSCFVTKCYLPDLNKYSQQQKNLQA